MSLIKERSPQELDPLCQSNSGNRERFTEEKKRAIYNRAVTEGILSKLTPNQQWLLRLRGYGNPHTSLMPFRDLPLMGQQGISFQAAADRENRALRRLDKIMGGRTDENKRLKMTEEEKESMLRSGSLPNDELARRLGHSVDVIARWKRELDIPTGRVGRPKKETIDK